MREIKFRAWDGKRLHYDIYLKGKEVYRHYGDLNGVNKSPTLLWVHNKSGKETVGDKGWIMQYTGLKDKNGKEIYEGDILRIIPNSDDIYDVKVIFHKGCFCYKTNDGGIFAFYSSEDYLCITENKEIIGNIYEKTKITVKLK